MTFWTCYGTYKYNIVSFRLINGPAAFQCFINNILGMDFLDNFIIAFIDDLIIYSKNKKDYKQHIKIVLQ